MKMTLIYSNHIRLRQGGTDSHITNTHRHKNNGLFLVSVNYSSQGFSQPWDIIEDT